MIQKQKKTAKIAGLNRKTTKNYCNEIRQAIEKISRAQTIRVSGEIELDESCFGGKRKSKDKRKRRSADKIPVLTLKGEMVRV